MLSKLLTLKYLAGIGLLATGIIIGYYWGSSPAEMDVDTTDDAPQEYITEVIRDTIVQTETVEVPVANIEKDTSELVLDTLEMESDTLFTELSVEDTLNPDEEELSINREKLLKSIKLPIKYLSEEDEKDTTIKDMLGIEETKATHLIVEFWQSPLNFEGYKLSKSKLILYGLSPQFEYKIYRKDEDFYLSYQEIYYLMRKTQDFSPYLQVEKEKVFE